MSARIPSPLASPQRLAALRSTELLDTPGEEQFDRLTRLASQAFRAPIAAITLVDDHRQFFKSAVGIREPFDSRREVPLSYSFCKYVVRSGRPFQVEDARRHRWLMRSPAIGELGMVAYLGVPLRVSSGHVVGSFFLSDSVPRLWSAEERRALEDFARLAAEHISPRVTGPSRARARDGSETARRAIEELFTTTARFHVLVEQSIVGIGIVQDLRIRYANPVFARMFGYADHEALALPSFLELVVEEDRPAVSQRLQDGIASGPQGFRFQFRGRRRDGEQIHVEVHGSRSEIDGAAAVVGVLLDTTEREEANAAREASEERFRRLFEDDLTGNLIATPDGRIIACNAAFVRMFGYDSAEEVLSADAARFFAGGSPPDGWMERLSAEGRIEMLESELLRKDGRRIHVLENAVVTRDDAGTITEICRYLFDITKRKQVEEALQRSEERFRTITENSRDIVHILDDRGAVRYISPAVHEVLGYRPEELTGRPGLDLVHPADVVRMERAFSRAMRQPGSEWFVEVRLRHRDGSWRTAEVGGKTLIDRTGERIAIVNTHDITQRVEVQEALARSEERFRLVGRATNDVLWEWDLASGTVLWGEAAPNVFRFAPEDVGASIEWWVEHVHPEDRERVVSGLHQVLNGAGQIWSCEYRFLRGDGVTATMLDRGYVVRDETGTPSRVTGSMMDITERRRSEETHRLLARVSALLESSLEPGTTLPTVARAVIPVLADYCLIDLLEDEQLRRAAEAHVVPAQQALIGSEQPQPLTEIAADDPLGKVVREHEPLLVPDVTASFAEARAAGAEHLDRFVRTATQSLMIIPLVMRERLLGVLTLATVEPGRRYGPMDLLVAQDLGRRIALALENARLFRDAQQAVRDREQVLGVVSHDLRNPLSTIKLSADLLRETGEERRSSHLQWLDVIGRCADEMERLIDDLLDLSSIEAGGFTVDPEDHDVESLLKEVCASFQPLADQASITLRYDPGTVRSTAWIDTHRIRRVFANLLTNALKFTPPGGTITLRVEGSEREIRFSVSDTGPGIPKEQLPFVFDRYWQARKGDRRGAGLGLSIARGIVEAHGGRLWVKSTPGQGTTFYFTVAATPREQLRLAAGADGVPGGAAKAPARPAARGGAGAFEGEARNGRTP